MTIPNYIKKKLKNRIAPTMYLEPPTIYEIVATIRSLVVNKAVGHDNISPFFLKTASLIITPYLNILTHYAFSNGIFPDSC